MFDHNPTMSVSQTLDSIHLMYQTVWIFFNLFLFVMSVENSPTLQVRTQKKSINKRPRCQFVCYQWWLCLNHFIWLIPGVSLQYFPVTSYFIMQIVRAELVQIMDGFVCFEFTEIENAFSHDVNIISRSLSLTHTPSPHNIEPNSDLPTQMHTNTQ